MEELIIYVGISTKEAKAGKKTHLVTAKSKARKYSM